MATFDCLPFTPMVENNRPMLPKTSACKFQKVTVELSVRKIFRHVFLQMQRGMFTTSIIHRQLVKQLIFTWIAMTGFLFWAPAYSQTPTTTLVGRVLDAKSGQPLPFATVYINNTPRGTTADESGAYRLTSVPLGNQELVASNLGYQTLRQPLRLTDTRTPALDIKLDPTGQSLASVTVTGRHSKAWERQFRQFSRELLGNRPHARQCHITNPNVLSFQDKDGHLLASATEPLLIDNEALGYRLHYDLLQFDFYQNRMNFAGTVRFEELPNSDARQQARWQAQRQKTYQGSLQHLLANLLTGTHERAGYTVYQSPLTGEDYTRQLLPLVRTANRHYLGPDQARALFRPGDLPFERRLVSAQPLEVYYNRVYAGNSPYHDSPYAYSMLLLPNQTLELTTTGGITQGNGLDVRGYLGNDRLATLLPIDWLPAEAENLIPTDIEAGKTAKPDAGMDSLDALRQHQYQRTAPVVYVQTDKGFYCTGDQLWLSAYVLDAARQLPVAGKNGAIQVELVDPNGHIVEHQWLRLTDGRAAGSFRFSDTLSAGNYRLRAYTALDQPANGPAFERSFPLCNIRQTESTNPVDNGRTLTNTVTPKQSTVDSLDVQFLPEGGRWLTGVPGNLGIKSLDKNGQGQAVSGWVVNRSGAEVARFQTNGLGMGRVTLTPQTGEAYSALIDPIANAASRPVPLPVTEAAGWSLSADAVSDSSRLTVRVRATGKYEQQPIYITLQSRERFVYRQKWLLPKGEAQFSLPTGTLPAGVCRLTLWDMTNQPRAERLVFIPERSEAIQMRVSSGKIHYESRQTVDIGLQFRDADDYPVGGSWSAAVTDADQLTVDTIPPSMRTYLLLTADLRGRVESPTYYLEPDRLRELDNLLLTQGWRRLPAPQPTDSTGGWSLSGRVIDQRGKPVKQGPVIVQLEQNDQKILRSLTTDTQGVFRLSGLQVADTVRVVARALESPGAKLTFDAPGVRFNPPPPPIQREPTTLLADARSRQTAWPAFYRDSTACQLAEVIVRANKPTAERPIEVQRASIHGEADGVFVPKNGNDYQNLGTMLSQVPGMSQLRNRNHSSFGDNSPLYLIDGVIVEKSMLKDVLDALSPGEVSRIELLKNAGTASIYGARGANGVIAIYTKKGGEAQPPERTSVTTTVNGFATPREFYVPRYGSPEVSPYLDRRDVLFWQPLGESGPDGLANLAFPLNDTAKRLRIVVQGVTNEGAPISFTWVLPVR